MTGNGKKFINKIRNLNIAFIGLVIYLKWPKPAPPVYPTVQAEPLMVEDVEIYVEYAGKIKARQHVEIRARVEGYLERMFFEEGGYVEKNDLLYSIDPKLYRARVEKASAQLKKNTALMQKAERDLQRIRPLYEQNAASQLDLDNAIAAYEAAQAEVVMSEADLAQAEIARFQYLNGQIEYIDVLDYFNAEIDYSNAVRDLYLAMIVLYKALGGGMSL